MAVLLGGLAACSLPIPQWGTNSELEVRLPAPPPAWEPFGALAYSIVLPAPQPGQPSPSLRVDAGARSIHLTIEKSINLPILAYPLLQGRADLLRPAGGVFPFSLDERGRLELSYRDGFLAQMLFPLYGKNDLIAAVNVERLSEAIWERSLGDPWSVDRERILVTLVYGTMRSDRISLLPAFSLSISAHPGIWIAGDPFRAPLTVPLDSRAFELDRLPTGIHHFFRVSEDATTESKSITGRGASDLGAEPRVMWMPPPLERIDLIVSEDGWLSLDSTTGDAESGRW